MVEPAARTTRLRLQPGGALRPDAAYARRGADDELLSALREGRACLVSGPRQIGKSSLRARTMRRLEDLGWRCATVDLSLLIGAEVDERRLFTALADELARELGVDAPFELPAGQRPSLAWLGWLREIARSLPGRAVVFLDEIDAVYSRRVHFDRDELLGAVRAAVDAGAHDEAWARLTWCLMGVATAAELIVDEGRTPFNNLHGIVLEDLRREEVAQLRDAFEPDEPAEELLEAAWAWSAGHPYMLQRLCEAARRDTTGTPADRVHRCARRLYQGEGLDADLAGCAVRLFAAGDRLPTLLALYRRALDGLARDGEAGVAELLLTGLVARRGGQVVVRNRIVADAFPRSWVDGAIGRRALAEAATRWVQHGRRPAELLRGDALEEARAWADGRLDLSPEELGLLLESTALARREEEAAARQAQERALLLNRRVEAERRLRIQRRFSVALGLVVVLLAIALGVALRERRRAQEADQARQVLERRRAALLAESARSLAETPGRERQSLAAALSLLDQPAEAVPPTTASEILSIALANATSMSDLQLGSTAWDLARAEDGAWAACLGSGALLIWPDTPDTSAARVIATDRPGLCRIVWIPGERALVHAVQNGGVWRIDLESERARLLAPSALGGPAAGPDPDPLVHVVGERLGRGAIAVSPDGQVAIGDWMGQVVVLDSHTGQTVARWRAHEGPVSALLWARGAWWTGGSDGAVRTYARGRRRDALPAGGPLVELAAGGGDLVAFGFKDGTIRAWSPSATWVIPAHRRGLTALAVSPGGDLIASAADLEAPLLWRADDARQSDLPGLSEDAYALGWSADGGALVAVGGEGSGRVWRGRPRTATRAWQVGPGFVTTVAWHGTRLFASAGPRVMELNWGGPRTLLRDDEDETNHVAQLAVYPDRARALALTWEGRARWLYLDSGASSDAAFSVPGGTSWAGWAPNGETMLVVGQEGKARRRSRQGWLLSGWNFPLAPTKKRGKLRVSWSPDGRQLAVPTENGAMGLYDATNGELQARLTAVPARALAAAWSPDGRRMVTGHADGTLAWWEQGRLIDAVTAHEEELVVLAWSPDGRWLATGATDGPARIWDVATRAPALRFGDTVDRFATSVNGHWIGSMAWSPDSAQLAVGAHDGTVLLYDVGVEPLLASACAIVEGPANFPACATWR